MNASTSDYVIRPGELEPGWALLYAVTWAVQWICAGVRYTVSYGVLFLTNWIAGGGIPVHGVALVIAFGPLVLSIATLVLPLGGWFFERESGGRPPSERERAVFDLAFTELQAHDPQLRPPRRWFVTDDPEPNACVYGDTLMVTRGMLDSPFFAAVLAHELGHCNSSDGRLAAALYRITTPPRKPVGFPFKALAFLATGRIGMSIVRTPWAIYWRRREAVADQYADGLGQGPQLAAYLETHALEGDIPTPFKAFGDTLHPWAEHRIDQLQTRPHRRDRHHGTGAAGGGPTPPPSQYDQLRQLGGASADDDTHRR
jgi:Zn-dependent protease with chaperone function